MLPEAGRLERSIELYRGLVKVSALINSIPDFDGLLASILEIAREVLGAEASSLFLTREDGDLEMVIARGSDGRIARKALVVPRGQGIAGWVVARGEPLLVPDAYADPRFYQDADRQTGFKTRSIVCVPLKTAEGEIGVLQALNPAGREAFDALDLEAFEAYAVLVASAIERLRVLERQIEGERVSRELSLAKEIQGSFLPPSLPEAEGFASAVIYRPARNIGGDFYDIVRGEEGLVHFAIGDVSGKGIPAALLMAQSLSAFRFVLRPGMSPAELLRAWNGAMIGRTIRGMFVTALAGRLDVATGEVEVASAGHCRPVAVGPGGGAEEWPLEGALPLGIFAGAKYGGARFRLEPGGLLALFTDGLTESFDPSHRPLDPEGVRRLLSPGAASPEELVAVAAAGERSHRAGEEPHDDMTLLVLGRPLRAGGVREAFDIEARPEELAGMRERLRDFFARAGVPRDAADLAVLATDEACTNVIRHAYGGSGHGGIALCAERDGDWLRVKVRDFGKRPPDGAFEPRPLDPTTPGGFGLHFLRAAFDRIDPVPRDPGTELVLEKRLPAE